tara:strand:+ start:3804 stop:4136 length:333 start_codon:yes stop_codon:yes gene_type:complete
MSHYVNDTHMDRIVDEVTDLWVLKEREDLLDDCIDYVADNYMSFSEEPYGADIPLLVIKFLSTKAHDAISSTDLDVMAKEDEEALKQDKEYCEHCGETLDKCTGYKCWIR